MTSLWKNNVNGHGVSKSKKVEIIDFPGATSTDIEKNRQ